MNHTPADIVRHLLVELAHGTLPSSSGSWPIFAHNLPDTPDNAVVVYDTQGVLEGRSGADGGVMDEHPGIQVRVRSSAVNTGNIKAEAIAEALDQNVLNYGITITNTTGTATTTYTVHAVTRKSGVLRLGRDNPSSDCYSFTINSIVAISQEV